MIPEDNKQLQEPTTISMDQVNPEPPTPSTKFGFFQGLFAKTQNLINKTADLASQIGQKTVTVAEKLTNQTQNIANTVVEKTTRVSDTLTQAPNQIANQASNLIDQGIQASSQLKDGIKTHTTNLIKDPMNGVKNLSKDLTNTAESIGSQAIQTSNQGLEKIGSHANQLIKEGSTQLEKKQNIGTLLENISNGVKSAYEKTKEIGTEAFDSTKNFVQNPVESLDHLTGNGGENKPSSQPAQQLPTVEELEKQIPQA